MQAYAVEPWSDFAVATAGAAAALAGLLFVAVSINLQVIVGSTHLPGRAAQALIMLATPVFLSLSMLVPGQGSTALGVEMIAIAVLVGSSLGRLARPSHRAREQPVAAWLVTGVVPSAVLLLSPTAAGVGLMTSSLGGLYWVPVTVCVALIGGLINAWALLIEILR